MMGHLELRPQVEVWTMVVLVPISICPYPVLARCWQVTVLAARILSQIQ